METQTEQEGMEESMDVIDYDKCLEISYASAKLNDLKARWDTRVVTEVEWGRLKRFQKVDVENRRTTGELLSDETFVEMRAIETAVSRTKPAFLGYLKSPTNLMIFVKPEEPSQSYEDLEVAFARLLKYPSWDEPHIQCIDCMLLHGTGAIEVLYDLNAPGHVSLEYVSREDLIFHEDTTDIQQQEYVMRRYEWTKVALQSHARTFSYDKDVVKNLCCEFDNSNTVNIFKVYIKTADGLYIAWWADKASDKWLKAPIPYTVGFVEPETYVPLFVLRKDLLEDTKILSIKGLAYLMESTQLAASAIYSGVINGVLRATNPIFSPSGVSDAGTQEPFTMRAGYVAKRGLTMHVPDYPSPELLMTADALRRQAMEDQGHVNYAVEQSQSTRKTATEVASANATQANLNSVSVANFSTFLGEIYTYAWRIVQREALNDRIELLGERDPVTGNFINDKIRISGKFLILPSGDREFLRREEIKQAMRDFMPFVDKTPLAKVIIADALTYALPMNGQRYRSLYSSAVASQDITLGLIGGILQRLKTEGLNLQFSPEEAQQLDQLYNEYQRIYGIPSGSQTGMAQTPNNTMPIANTAPSGGGPLLQVG